MLDIAEEIKKNIDILINSAMFVINYHFCYSLAFGKLRGEYLCARDLSNKAPDIDRNDAYCKIYVPF